MRETFERTETKYLISREQLKEILNLTNDYLQTDRFFKGNLMSIYYDTDSYQMIRCSIEKPEYKEKIRIRSYDDVEDNDSVYVEYKKKYNGIVYKRRTTVGYKDAMENLYDASFEDRQVAKEIKRGLIFYKDVKPKIFISTRRYSYRGKEDENLRITFDLDMKYRTDNLCLKRSDKDKTISDGIVMEIKTVNPYPLWLVKVLNETKAYPQSFSKVGEAYIRELKNGGIIL
ncbi:MAG: polyphosphate polymerase domain-containing protein [Erysipelotrichaceae bacterium]|nr:polyphosphate polymerase domain-containing protein [Erysipelotrichaceae bacterium]